MSPTVCICCLFLHVVMQLSTLSTRSCVPPYVATALLNKHTWVPTLISQMTVYYAPSCRLLCWNVAVHPVTADTMSFLHCRYAQTRHLISITDRLTGPNRLGTRWNRRRAHRAPVVWVGCTVVGSSGAQLTVTGGRRVTPYHYHQHQCATWQRRTRNDLDFVRMSVPVQWLTRIYR